MGYSLFFIPLLMSASFALAQVEVESPCPANQVIAGEYIVRLKTNSTSLDTSGNLSLAKVSTARTWIAKSLSMQIKSPVLLDSPISQSAKDFSAGDMNPSVLAVVRSSEDLESIKNDLAVESIEANCIVKTMSLRVPNDPDIGKNWALALIGVPQAWGAITESNIVIAVPDTGIDTQHGDLSQNIWTNTAELNGRAGVDDDGNGYIDDIYGWGFPEKNNDVLPGGYIGAEHGTHIAGILGAVGNNNYGSAGLLWKTKIMALRPFKKTVEEATTADLIESIYYAVNNGAQIINCSWGSQQAPTKAEIDAYNYAEAHGVFVAAAAGNDAQDVSAYSPASLGTVFAVGSINSQRLLSTFSSFGPKIGVLAPGGDAASNFGIGKNEGIYSTLPGNSFGTRSGTSMSAPFVAATAAMIKTILPAIMPAEMRRLLVNGADKVQFKLNGTIQTYSILNVDKAVSLATEISRSSPQCSDNCSQAIGSGDFSSSAPLSSGSRFGGGCALHANLTSPNSKTASSSWDLAILLCFLFPAGRMTLRNRKSRDQ
jgi:hypothetical protein